ncbi:hypothetical protein [Pseudomonas syringae]|uniref:hypothetical protein n=1 Tax=Pseudomonas syringae TaxID=317 RepID=UPI0011C40D96|nr:hypothetical protein [Pseudomonas syringae]
MSCSGGGGGGGGGGGSGSGSGGNKALMSNYLFYYFRVKKKPRPLYRDGAFIYVRNLFDYLGFNHINQKYLYILAL